jgi:hypothetical protein
MSDTSYVRVISTLTGGFRNKGVGHNFRDMTETADFIDRLKKADLTGVKQIRIIPTEVTFTDPKDAARGLNGASSSGYNW